MPKAKGVSLTKGVELNAPPPHLFRDISASMEAFAATLKPGEQGGLVGIATTKGVQIAVVQKVGGAGTVVAWVGKSSGWGEPLDAGLAWKLTWS